MSYQRPAYYNDFGEVNLNKEIKSIRQPRQSFLCALIARNHAGEAISDTIALKYHSELDLYLIQDVQ